MEFLNQILCTEDSTFKRNGYLNLYNLRAWHLEKEHLMLADRTQFKVSMWIAILNGKFELHT
ncbi:UNVERIFIED_CONTAM: hypothetical protein NCL1_62812 [Trichonephila clavipes]